ncbi:helix-turn-helix domain-containing protein [Paenibacillus sp. LMG 31456]|uniref:Helix-turn-helix domain-containing protein n=1 Tax=Paenibacillus foliorum TaxID=2654974 RepID=A0A972K421_9BACL|nr:helix-turn-helix domain-containing protein [Paenibacillus foliorum]NOU98391.1 helix-turn-helix domain-containing protein [Paenibacillus foliorum]
MNILKKWFNRRTMYSSILFSYLLMLIIPLLIETFSYFQYSNLINKETEAYNLSLLKQSQRVLDDRLQSIEEMTINLSLDTQVQRFINVSENMDAVDKYNMSKLIETLSNYKKTNSFIYGIYIYFPNSNSVITETAKSTASDFHKYVYRYADWGFDDWKYSINQNHNLEYRTSQITQSEASDPNHVISLLQSVYQGSLKQPVATIVITIDEKKVEKLLSNGPSALGNLYVLDRSGHTIFGIGDPSLLSIPKEELLNHQSSRIHVDNQQYLVSSIHSTYRERQYVSITSVEFIKNDLKRITDLVILVTIGLITAGIALAFILAKGKYRPIKKLADAFSAKMRAVPTDAANELKQIEWIADNAFKENENFLHAMQRQMPVMRSNMLLTLMKGSITDEENSFEDIGIQFNAPYFSVIIVHVDQYHESKLKELNLSKFVISNVLEHLGRELGPSYAVDLDVDRVALLINLSDESDAVRQSLHEVAIKALEFIGAKFNNTITVSIGDIHDKLEGIYHSYLEASRAMEYQIIRGYSSIISFDEIKAMHKPQTYVYPIQTEELLISSIKHGDIKKVREIMNDVYEMNFVSGQLPLEMARCLFFDMMGTSIKVLNSSVMDFEKIFADGPQPYERLISSRTIQEMQATLLWIYEQICQHIHEDKKKNSNHLEDRITAYLQENYADPNLSLTKVADVFNLSSTYLSGLFKEQSGENFLNYVNKLRVEAAKTILVEQSVSLQEIATKVGYSNNVVLIRNFKKYVGMTPGEYRDKSTLTDRKN